jgi:hypothetical protein
MEDVMDLLLVPLLVMGLPPAGVDDAAVVDRVKQVGTVHVGYADSRRKQHVIRMDIRITGDKDPREVAAALKGLAKLSELENIMLIGPAFTNEAVKELAQVKSLRDVQLHRTQVTDEGIQALASLPNLRRLIFFGSGLTDKGLKHVAQIKGLQYLELTDAPITDEGLKTLETMSELRRLSIVNSQASRAALKQLFQTLPYLEARSPNTFNG